jgi:hypothetical protein
MRKAQPLGQAVIDNFEFLKTIAATKSENKQKLLLSKATADQILALTEIALNIIKSKFLLTPRQKLKLLPHVNFVRRLGRVKTEKNARKIVQKGSGVGIAALLAPIVVEGIKYLIEKKNEH